MAAKRRRINKLSGMTISEVSLVDLPANQHSSVVLFKRADPAPAGSGITTLNDEDDDMKTLEELAKALEDADATITDLTKRAEAAEAKLAEVQKGAAKQDEAGTGAEDDVLKSLPEPLRKRLEQAEARAQAAEDAVRKQADEAATREYVAKAGAYQNLAVDPEKFGPVLKRIAGHSVEDAQAVMDVLKAANEAVGASGVLKAKGAGKAGDTTGSNAEAKLNKMAEDRAKADGVSFAKAYSAVVAENADLYAEYLGEKAR